MKLTGLRKASGRTRHCEEGYYQVVLDLTNNEVSAIYHWTDNEWLEHPDYLDVAHTKEHMTMKEIMAKAEEGLYWLNWVEGRN